MNIKLISITESPEKHIEYCARISKGDANNIITDFQNQFLQDFLMNGHLSVFEHAWASFLIEGISRACSHQLVRQRIASFTQRSQRYVKEEKFNYTIPPEIQKNPETIEVYQEAMMRVQESYNLLIGLGINKEDARFLLPNAIHTALTMTANFREWLHIIDIRVSRDSQWEIRDLSILIWKELYHAAPAVFDMCYFQQWGCDSDFKNEIFHERIC